MLATLTTAFPDAWEVKMASGEDGVRPFATVTLGNLLAAIPAIAMCVGLIVWATTQGNNIANQSEKIARIEQTYYSKDDANGSRERRDQQIKSLQENILSNQNSINTTLTLISNRMDRAFERLDKLQSDVVELKTIINLGQSGAKIPPRLIAPQPNPAQ